MTLKRLKIFTPSLIKTKITKTRSRSFYGFRWTHPIYTWCFRHLWLRHFVICGLNNKKFMEFIGLSVMGKEPILIDLSSHRPSRSLCHYGQWSVAWSNNDCVMTLHLFCPIVCLLDMDATYDTDPWWTKIDSIPFRIKIEVDHENPKSIFLTAFIQKSRTHKNFKLQCRDAW